jgi:hypothetical protein
MSRRLIFFVSIIVILAGIFIAFSKRNNPSNDLTQQQTNFSKTATADPILKHLPYGALDYDIQPVFKVINNKRVLTLQITIFLTGADYKQSHQAIDSTVKTKEDSALDYIKTQGFDPSKYQIDFIVPSY